MILPALAVNPGCDEAPIVGAASFYGGAGVMDP
jgi:hypothetical protein